MQYTHGFVSADAGTLIDIINPATHQGVYGNLTLEQIQTEYPGATVQAITDFCAAKGARQDGEPKLWTEITEDRYNEMLNVLPPAAYGSSGSFMVGEPTDHHAATGRPRFSCFKAEYGKFYALNRPVTFREFKEMFGNSQYHYVS